MTLALLKITAVDIILHLEMLDLLNDLPVLHGTCVDRDKDFKKWMNSYFIVTNEQIMLVK